MTPENRRLVARMLCHAGQDPDRMVEEAERKKERKLSSPVGHLRKCLREQQAIDNFERIKERLI